MKYRNLIKISSCIMLLALVLAGSPATAQTGQAQIGLLDGKRQALTTVQDGNLVAMSLALAQKAGADLAVTFHLDEIPDPVGRCTIPTGSDTCQTELAPAYGWYWRDTGEPMPARRLSAQAGGAELAVVQITVKPRPVVMVHGFNSNFHTWDAYLGANGLLQAHGLHGYAVGDGQVAGVMQTGSLSAPLERTFTIAENAEILAQYIALVRQATGAEQVDLLVHSMGGMISRYYLDRLMEERQVAQLIILGTPMSGSACALLPASLGLLLPATIEIQPAYMDGIFNPQIQNRRGVPFHALAGTKLQEGVQSPCTPAPSDLVVTLDSVRGIAMPVQEMPLLHMDLNTSIEVFEQFVLPLLRTPPTGVWQDTTPVDGAGAAGTPVQYSQTYTGHLNAGESVDIVIPIDAGVSVANFALYDTSRSLVTEVTGASGNVLQLDPVKNGMIQVDDPDSLLYLGYGFSQPKPGRWVVRLLTTAQTPADGADYAIMAQFQGGASLVLSLDTLLPEPGATVTLKADLTSAGLPLALDTVQVKLLLPDGSTETRQATISGNSALLEIKAQQTGLHLVEVAAGATGNDGQRVERAAVAVFEVLLDQAQVNLRQILGAAGLAVLVIVALFVWRWRRRARLGAGAQDLRL